MSLCLYLYDGFDSIDRVPIFGNTQIVSSGNMSFSTDSDSKEHLGLVPRRRRICDGWRGWLRPSAPFGQGLLLGQTLRVAASSTAAVSLRFSNL